MKLCGCEYPPYACYPKPWGFLKQFDLWTPFDDYDDWSPVKNAI
ncbi:hypothetical protein [Alysiella crassa]|nr:hypothetical protein [Alysiella crassa]